MFYLNKKDFSPKFYTTVLSVHDNIIEVSGINQFFTLRQVCFIEGKGRAEVVGFKKDSTLIMSYTVSSNVMPGDIVYSCNDSLEIFPDESWKGRVLNAFCEPIDALEDLFFGEISMPLFPKPLNALNRARIKDPLDIGVASINTFLTCCIGQRMGIFAGSGVGKSMLISMIAKYSSTDICVIGLIGERGREVREFLEETLGPEGIKKSIIIVSTSDESCLMKRRGAYSAIAIAEYFRNKGLSVMCLVDSLTRFAYAQKEIEDSVSILNNTSYNKYSPTTIAELSRLLERAGPGEGEGMITGFFSVLIEGDDMNDPVADIVRSILDGHIVLDRKIAERSRFPSINILKSVSRVLPKAHTKEEQEIIKRAKEIIAEYEEIEDMIKLGIYKKGSSERIDYIIDIYPKIENFLNQSFEIKVTKEDAFERLKCILS